MYMKTTLNGMAYIVPFLLFVAPLLIFATLRNLDSNGFEKFLPLVGISTLACWGMMAFTLLVDYYEYTCDDTQLTMRNLVSKQQASIALADIQSLRLVQKRYKNGKHHNIEVTHKAGKTTLKGIYTSEIEAFFHHLQGKIKH
jgi:hypothetical protein